MCCNEKSIINVISMLILLFCSSILHSQSSQDLLDSANYYQKAQDYETAIQFTKQALHKIESAEELNYMVYILIASQLSSLFDKNSDLDSTIYYDNIIYSLYKKHYTVIPPKFIQHIRFMSFTYFKKGNLVKAESLSIEALDMSRKLFKNDHADLAASINNLAGFYE